MKAISTIASGLATLMLALMLTGSPALAGEQSARDGSDQSLGDGFTRPGSHAGQVIGDSQFPSKDLYRVEFIEINGRNISSARDVMWLEPGTYNIKARMLARNPPGMSYRSRGRHERGYNEIELVVEAGKTYYLGARYDRSDRRAPYRLVLYRVGDEMVDLDDE